MMAIRKTFTARKMRLFTGIMGGIGTAALALMAGTLNAGVREGVDAWSAGNYERAVEEWRVPAQNGDPDALFNLAQAYRLGRGVPADIGRARELYAEAAQRGHLKAADNYGLLLFQQGEQQTAMPFITDAAGRGDPRAQYVLALAHFNADYAQRDWVRAYALMTLANSAGLPQAGQALEQMDQYIPIAQRQQAQTLARQLESEATQRRAAQLAALELGTGPAQGPSQSAVQRAPVTPAPVTVAPAPVRSSPAPAPQPVRVAEPARPVPVPGTSVPVSASQPSQSGQRTGSWRIQLGAFGVASNAERLWSRLAGNPALAGTRRLLVPSGRVTRLQAEGYASRAEAEAACSTLQRQGHACMVAGS